MKYMSALMIAKLPLLLKIVGLTITFFFMNLLIFIYLSVAEVVIRLWKLLKWIYELPLVFVIIGFFKCMYNFCVSIAGKG